MGDTLAGGASRAAALSTIAALALSGVGTGTLLHLRAVHARDELLVTALAAERQPHTEPREATEGRPSVAPVPVRVVRDLSALPGLPADALARARAEQVVFCDVGDRRVLLAPLEDGEEADEPELEPPHQVVAVVAPKVPLAESIGPFAAVYSVIAAAVAGLVLAVQRRFVAHALAPLAAATEAARNVAGFRRGRRLPVDGPREVRALPEAVNALLDRLEAAWEAEARFTSEAAHELRTPLAALRAEIDLALRRPRSAEDYAAALGRVDAAAGRLGRLVDALLALARVDAGHVEAGRERVRASEVVLAAARQEQAGLAAAGCALMLDLAGDAEVDVHVTLATAAVANLLRNAARYAPGAPVRVTIEPVAGRVVVAVEDGGPGVPPERREAVFERFGRGAAGSQVGLGLGLALARAVARRHGGDCRIADAATGGARMEWWVPAAEAQGTGAERDGYELAPVGAARGASPSGSA